MDELIKALTRAANAVADYYEQEALNPVKAAQRSAALATEPKPEAKPRTPRKTAKETTTAAPAESPFGAFTPPAPKAEPVDKPSVEELLEVRRRNQDVIGLFIRRFIKSQPTGLERAKALIQREVPSEVGKKLEEFAYESCVKLIPVFETELEKAEAK